MIEETLAAIEAAVENINAPCPITDSEDRFAGGPEILYGLIRRFEGCSLTAYSCPAGIWTIGWGSTGIDVYPGLTWTQEEADARMHKDANKFIEVAQQACPNLTGPGLYAIADFAYNVGSGALRGSTLRKKINENNKEEAITQLLKWVRGGGRVLPGLVKRRRAEADILAQSIF
jgi:lysozyme